LWRSCRLPNVVLVGVEASNHVVLAVDVFVVLPPWSRWCLWLFGVVVVVVFWCFLWLFSFLLCMYRLPNVDVNGVLASDGRLVVVDVFVVVFVSAVVFSSSSSCCDGPGFVFLKASYHNL
jgi:hypothetical protein